MVFPKLFLHLPVVLSSSPLKYLVSPWFPWQHNYLKNFISCLFKQYFEAIIMDIWQMEYRTIFFIGDFSNVWRLTIDIYVQWKCSFIKIDFLHSKYFFRKSAHPKCVISCQNILQVMMIWIISNTAGLTLDIFVLCVLKHEVSFHGGGGGGGNFPENNFRPFAACFQSSAKKRLAYFRWYFCTLLSWFIIFTVFYCHSTCMFIKD